MKTLHISHMSPGNRHHMQSVLENKHYGKKINILKIIFENGEKYIDYEVLEKGEQND